MQKKNLIFILFLLVSCSFLPESRGQINEIIVISSQEDKILIEPHMADLFSNTIYTPQAEQVFILNHRNPWELKNYEEYGNIIIASLNFPEDSTTDILARQILDKHNQDVELLILGDLYARNQLLCIITAQDAVAFEYLLENSREWILEQYNTLFAKKMNKQIFMRGKNNELSYKIYEIFGHTIDLQPDFKLIRSDSLNSFIWVGRGYPYRWIVLHTSEKNKYINIESAWAQLIKDFMIHMPDITISKHYRNNEKVPYTTYKIPVMRGIYEHSESDTGGPFFVYIFETEQTNEVILVSGFINYPGHEKLLLLKQLEIIAKTLRKGEPT